MGPRVLVMGAGTGASNNLVASLRASIPSAVLVGCHGDPFVLKKSTCDRRYLFESGEATLGQLAEIVAREAIDLVIPTGDRDVELLSAHREDLGSHVFLPPRHVIDLCRDKYELAAFLARHDVPVPASFPVGSIDDVDAVFEKLAWAPRVWCRLRVGSRSLGASPLVNAGQARGWMDLWQSLRQVPPEAFMLAEYLPGNDYLCQGVWRDGQPVLVKTFERIAYFGGENSPSGTSSLSSLAKTVRDDRIVDVSSRAVRTLGPDACGAFSIDLKENGDGVPCITEINAGRFFIGMTALDHVGTHNMSACFVRLALGEPLAIADPYDCPPDHYLVRDLDTLPGVFSADDILAGIERLAP